MEMNIYLYSKLVTCLSTSIRIFQVRYGHFVGSKSHGHGSSNLQYTDLCWATIKQSHFLCGSKTVSHFQRVELWSSIFPLS